MNDVPVEPALVRGAVTISSDGGRVVQAELDQLFMEVNGLANQLKKTAAFLHRLEGLPAGGRRLLHILKVRGALTVPAMARLSLTSRQNVQIAVNRLKGEGWIGFEANPAHKRSMLARLTEQGEALVASTSTREENLRNRLVGQVSVAEVSTTTALLRKLRETLAEPRSSNGEAALGAAVRRKRSRKVADAARRSRTTLSAARTEPGRSELEEEEGEFPVNLL